jgi:predicted NBD/HSP70 family sugar kinase
MVVVPAKMGRLNQRAFLTRLQRMRAASRADLAKSMGMSQPTAGKIADELLEIGVLEEIPADALPSPAPRQDAASTTGRLGRPGRLLRLDQTRPRFLGIQLDVLDTKLAVLPVGANGMDEWVAEIPTTDSAAGWLRELLNAARRIPQKDFWGVLVSVPGIVDEAQGRVLFSPNLHWTERTDLPALLRQVWDAPVILVQEERVLALGHQSADPEADDFLLVDFGQGVGGAIVLGGRLYSNPVPVHGELGHTLVLGNQRPCGCGATGCLETLVAIRGLLQSFAEESPGQRHDWAALLEHIAQRGVVPWLARALDATGTIISGSLNVLGLRRVVITGALTDMPSAVMEYLGNAIVRGSLWARFGKIECLSAPRRRTAGLVAAGLDRLVLPVPGR